MNKEELAKLVEQLLLDTEQAKKDLDAAARAILQVIGNPEDAELVFLDELVLDSSIGAEIEIESAVQQAVDTLR